jgi:Family of unknown function (DUF5871)
MKKHISVDSAEGARALDVSAIGFREPKKVSSDAFVCTGFVAPNGDGLQLRVSEASVLRVTASKSSATIIVKVPKFATRLLAALDEHSVSEAMRNTDAWFMHKMSPTLIEDFYKPSTEVNSKGQGGIAARFKLVLSDTDIIPNLSSEVTYDMTIRLSGLQFRKQNFCLVWKLVQAKPAKAAAAPNKHGKVTSCMFGDDDADDDSDDASSTATNNDDDLIEPDAEDIERMVADIAATLDAIDGKCAADLKRCKEISARSKSLHQRFGKIQMQHTKGQRYSLEDLNHLSDDLHGLAEL